jgi:uncharacterized membrane protein
VELWQRLGELHPKLVQFPLVLLLMGLLFDLGGLVGRSRQAHWAGKRLTVVGTLGLLFAFICGIYAEIWAGRAGVPQHPIEYHELMANLASWGFVILLAWRLFLVPAQRRRMGVYIGLGLGWYALLALTAYLGGLLVFAYGAGVTGASANTVLSMDDLNTLACRQTDENLRYSEWMHHIFGWMTLGLAASLLAQAIWPKHAGKLKWIVPAFLLGGGTFLLFKADTDLYALTDMRQWASREVQLHKALALIMMVMGGVGMKRVFAKSPTAKRHAHNLEQSAVSDGDERALMALSATDDRAAHASAMTDAPAGPPRYQESGALGVAETHLEAPLGDDAPSTDLPPTAPAKGADSRLVAVLALIGGSLLFTHVHGVAPYANVAAGVYIAHVVLGAVALAIGATRIAQDKFPRWRRGLAIAFGGFMAVESLLLISYNEGLPWYIGYGTYNRWAPGDDAHVGNVVIAPYGNVRAALAVDPKTGRALVDVLDKQTGTPVALPADRPLKLLVTNGYRETAVELAAANGAAQASHFEGAAELLKVTPAFSARLALPLDGKDVMGYFDPWVTPVIAAVPPNELALFECPMHEGIRSEKAGECPLCGMQLVAINRAPRPADVLHDPAYTLAARTDAVDTTATLHLHILKDGAPVPLARVHGELMHVIVVSEDLAYFDHVHPVPEGDGFALTYRFPRDGRYAMFLDVTPQGDRQQVFRRAIAVSGKSFALANGDTRPTPADGWNPPALSLDSPGAKLITPITCGATPQTQAPLDKHLPPAAQPPRPPVLVELVSQPRALYAGLESTLLFRLSDAQGKPLTDLAPYIGAMGHCVVVSEDSATYLHSHPEQLMTPAPDERGGPVVAFHTLFPKPGVYRVWGQFRRPGREGQGGPGGSDDLIIADFTVEVKKPWVPAKVVNFFVD